MASALLGVRSARPRGDFTRTLQSLKYVILKFTRPFYIGTALCDVKMADVVAFVDSMDISRQSPLGYLGDLRTF